MKPKSEWSGLGEFVPTGDLWTRLSRNFARLEEEKYYPANVYQRANQSEKWPGDTEGRTLLAWVLLAQATGRAPRYLDAMLERWPAEMNELGYFGKIYTDGISEQQLSSHGWVLRALAELERWQPGGPAKALAQPIFENLFLPAAGQYAIYPIDPADRSEAGAYSGSHQKQIGEWILSTDIGCYVIGMDGVIDAYDVFRDERLVPLINEMVDRFLQIDLEPIEAQTHATLTACRGLIRWAAIADRPELIAAARERYDLYTGLAWTETYANYNWFNRPRWTEPCAMVDSLMVAMELWRHLGDTHYLDHAQLIAFNALGHGFRANGGYGCDTCPGADGSPNLAFSTYESHWCCTMRGGEGLARLSQYQVSHDPSASSGQAETLVLPFLLPGDYTSTNGSIFSLASGYPLNANFTITNNGPNSLTFKVYLPAWIDDIPGRDSDNWLILALGPGESKSLTGTLLESSRELLPSTQAFMAAHPSDISNLEFKVHTRGPLLLAKKPACLDQEGTAGLQPIYQAYLDGVSLKEHSSRRLLINSSNA